MMTMIIGGRADTEANAETVRPWVRSPARMVTIVTPAGKWRSAFRNSSDEITRLSSHETSRGRILPQSCAPAFVLKWHLSCTIHSAVLGSVEDTLSRLSGGHDSMGKIKSNVKGLLTQRVRIGLFTVPLWVVGAVFLARMVRDRRRHRSA